MSNYVYNKIICTEEILNKYFLDYEPFEESKKIDTPYITFNKLFNIKISEDYDKICGALIYYGDGFEYNKIDNNKVEILFNTIWNCPIKAIIRAIELCKNDIIWYACEESLNDISKFYWDDRVVEDILNLVDRADFDEFMIENEEKDEISNFWLWRYELENKSDWTRCNDDLIEKYYDIEENRIKDKKENTNENRDNDQMYYFLFVTYDNCEGYCKKYNYISDDLTIKIGDRVLVDRMGNFAVATVENVGFYNEVDAPYPVDMTKRIIKKVDEDFEIDDLDFYDEEYDYYDDDNEEFEDENILTINTEDTYFKFGILNYVKGKDNDENWTKIKLIMKNRYFNYYKNSEFMTSAEIDRLLSGLKRLINGKVKKKEKIELYEPDLTFELYPKLNLWRTGKNIYIKRKHEIQDIYMRLHIHLQDNDGAYTGQEYIITFDREEIEKFIEYIKSKIQKNN